MLFRSIGDSAKDFVHWSVLVVTIKPFAVFAGLGISAPLLGLLKGQPTFDGAVWSVEVGVVKTNDLVGGHGSASSKFLSDKELDFFHVLADFALCLAALGEIATGKAVGIFGLSCEQKLFGCCELFFDGGHGLIRSEDLRPITLLNPETGQKASGFQCRNNSK